MYTLRNAMICVAVAVCLIGCGSKSLTDPAPVETIPEVVGTQWSYWVYDSLSVTGDTVDVVIVGVEVDSRGRGTIWNVTTRGGGEGFGAALFHGGMSFVAQRGDSVLFYDARPGSDPYLMIVVPLNEGDSWAASSGGFYDSTHVGPADTLTIQAGYFASARRLDRCVTALDCGWNSRYWIVPGVGFVLSNRIAYAAMCGDNSRITWELLAYTIPNTEMPTGETAASASIPRCHADHPPHSAGGRYATLMLRVSNEVHPT